jgi:hypothetical protein
MKSIGPRLSALRSILALALGCSLIGGSAWKASANAGGAVPVGGLTISTDPGDALVFVDGRSAGVTPLQLPAVAAGEHRVRIVKEGYLENARVLTVAAGEPKTLHVTLTRSAESPAAAQVVAGGGGGGGMSKWVWIGLAGAGAATAGLVLSNRNKPPTPGTVTVSPTGTGIASVTNFTFTSQGASDPDGDGVTLTWNFGDGGGATGATVSRVYATAGTFNVSVTVSDGKADAKTPDVAVTTRNVAGTWVSNLSGVTRTWTLTQSITSAAGSYTSSGAPGTPGTVSGTLAGPRAFSGTAMLVGFTPFTFSGTFDSGISVLSVVAQGSGFTGETLTFNRQ